MMLKIILRRYGLLLVLLVILSGLFSIMLTCGGGGVAPVYPSGNNSAESTTLLASGITATAATLNGYVSSSKSCDTYWWFEWSSNPDLTKFEGETQHVKCWSGITYAYSIRLTGLSPQTMYHYRIASARDAPCGGQYYGSTIVFTTNSL